MNLPKSLTAVVTLLLLSAAGSALAFNPQPDPPGFGMIGITRMQTARLNVVMVGAVPNVMTRMVRLSFLDGIGNVLAQSTERLMLGQAAGLEFKADEGRVDVPAVQRKQIRASIEFLDGPHVKNLGVVLGTVEVFDTATGQTGLVLPGTNYVPTAVERLP